MDSSLKKVPSELTENERNQIREHVLAWISKDVGLCQFCVPDGVAKGWSAEQKQAWTNSVIANYVRGGTEDGKNARMRILSRENAGNLRRFCVKLRKEQLTHKEAAAMSVALEGLWDDVTLDLSDENWARCSLLFDTALISLRVAYVWLYLKTENANSEDTPDTRKTVFLKLVSSFFIPGAPTDDAHDKHTTNFRDLLSAWNKELSKYVEGDDFEEKLHLLESTQGLPKVGICVERFLNAVNRDQSWILKMKNLETKIEQGELVSKRGRKQKQAKEKQPPKESKFIYYSDDGLSNSVSSPDQEGSDMDFEIKDPNKFVVSTSTEDALTDSDEEYDRRRRRTRGEPRRSKRSRGATSKSNRTRPSRNGIPAREVRQPERFSPEENGSPYYASRTRGPFRPIGRKSKVAKQNGRSKRQAIISSDDDKEIPVARVVSPKRGRKEMDTQAYLMESDSDDPQTLDPLADLELKNRNFRLHGDDDPESDYEERDTTSRLPQRTSRKSLRENPIAARNSRGGKASTMPEYEDEILPNPHV